MAKAKKKRPMEFKKKLLVWVAAATSACIIASFVLSACGMEPVYEVTVALIETCLAAIVAYCIASLGEKNSRNKYGIDRNGNKIRDEEIGG